MFPQVAGLGFSDMSHDYAIADLNEAHAFLAHPVFCQPLREITELTNQRSSMGAREIFHDDKFHSSPLRCIHFRIAD